MGTPSLTASELEEKLDEYLDPVLSSRRTASPLARKIVDLPPHQQTFILHWVKVIARSNAEIGYQFADLSPQAFSLMDESGVEEWVVHVMDIYDKQGLYPACAELKDLESHAQLLKEQGNGVALEEVSGVLELFLCGLTGRRLKLEAGNDTHTDTETLFLPHRLALFPNRELNFKAYKAMAAYLWAQVHYGTFRVDLNPVVASYPSPEHALQCLHWLEFARLDSCLRKTLPGLHRQMNELRAGSQMGDEWQAFATLLGKQGSGVEASIALLPQVYPLTLPQPCCYMGRLYPERAEGIRQARILKEKDVFRSAIAQMTNDKKPSEPAKEPSAMEAGENNRLTLEKLPDPEQPNGFSFQLNLDGQPIIPPENVKSLMDSIIQDLGQIPEDYLVAAGDGGYRLTHDSHEKKPEDVWKGTYHEEGAHLYNEWDFNRRHYRKNWCVLRELSVHPGEIGFVEATLGKYYGQIAQLKRTFEILRGEEKQLKKQKHGTDIDLNAVVEAYADLASGMELSERLFTKLHKIERNIAVMFMVDMSGSTKGWINDAEREALVLLCEALEVLGDRYAIYGFSGITRKRCEVYKVKGFDEPYSTLVKQRIAGITPQDYTRMGVTIRHLSKLLEEQEARTKLLITLSDGKPDDYDTYRGEYGIEDTRQALIEAKQKGIHSFCITIDSEAREYLPHMYGAVNYTVIDDVKKLPLKMADIYRHITT